MTKKQIIKWWDNKTNKRLVEILNQDKDLIQGIRDEVIRELRIDALAEKVHLHVLAAHEALVHAKNQLTGNADVEIKGYGYNSFDCKTALWVDGPERALASILCHDIEVRPAAVKEITAARDARYGEENAQFHAVRENLLRLGTAKDCIKYLKSINIDVSDIESGSVDKVKDLKPVDPDKFRLPNKEGN